MHACASHVVTACAPVQWYTYTLRIRQPYARTAHTPRALFYAATAEFKGRKRAETTSPKQAPWSRQTCVRTEPRDRDLRISASIFNDIDSRDNPRLRELNRPDSPPSRATTRRPQPGRRASGFTIRLYNCVQLSYPKQISRNLHRNLHISLTVRAFSYMYHSLARARSRAKAGSLVWPCDATLALHSAHVVVHLASIFCQFSVCRA